MRREKAFRSFIRIILSLFFFAERSEPREEDILYLPYNLFFKLGPGIYRDNEGADLRVPSIGLALFILKRGLIFMAKLERDFQAKLIKEIKQIFKGCIVMKNDSSYIQGIPDLLILYRDKWAALEVKKSATAHHQPNQEYYVELMDEMSYASFVYPENKEEVLYELQQTLFSRR